MTDNPFDDYPPKWVKSARETELKAWREKWEPMILEALEKAEKYDELEKMFKIYTGELCWQQDRFIGVFKKLEAIQKLKEEYKDSISDSSKPYNFVVKHIVANLEKILEGDSVEV